MSDPQRLSEKKNPLAEAPPPPRIASSSSSSSSWPGDGTCKGARYPNPPETVNPDAATLREQWRYATRQYSRWYSSAWGAAIIAGVSFFALGWLIKGGNPLPSKSASDSDGTRQDRQHQSEGRQHQSEGHPS